jgi:hypothetical protein
MEINCCKKSVKRIFIISNGLVKLYRNFRINWRHILTIKTLAEAIEQAKNGRILIADEKGNLILKEDLTRLERLRIFFNQWWVFIAIIIAVYQVFQTVISVLNYLRCR